MTTILVGTDDGVQAFETDGRRKSHELTGRKITALGGSASSLWVVASGKEVWNSANGDWDAVAALDRYRANCIAATGAGVLLGTSEAHLCRVEKDGIESVEGFDQVDGRSEWYTPWGGPPDSRSIAEGDDAVFVNVHVGGIVRSLDGGLTWEATIDIHSDVHKVWAGSKRALAACAWGLASSADNGTTWEVRSEGLHAKYCRGVAVCGEAVVVSASNGPRGGRAALYRGRIEDGAFERCRAGLPEWFDGNIDSLCLDAARDGGVAAFGTEDGRIFASTDEGATWAELASGLSVNCLLVV